MDNQNDTEQYITNLYVKREFYSIVVSGLENGLPDVDLTPLEGHILSMLTRMVEAKNAVEFGTLAGYSAAWIANGMQIGGKLITYEVNPKYAELATMNMYKTKGCSRVEVRNEDAHEAIKTLDGTFDLVFIDADKAGYDAYLTWALDHVRVGGLIIAHNALWHGKITEFVFKIPVAQDDTTLIIRRFNARVANEPRLKSVILPVGDGLLVAQVVK